VEPVNKRHLTALDALVICTEWQNFKAPEFELIIFDARNLFQPVKMLEEGIKYYAIGRGFSVLNV